MILYTNVQEMTDKEVKNEFHRMRYYECRNWRFPASPEARQALEANAEHLTSRSQRNALEKALEKLSESE